MKDDPGRAGATLKSPTQEDRSRPLLADIGRKPPHRGRERLIPTGQAKMVRWRNKLFVGLSRNAQSATQSSAFHRTVSWSWDHR